MIRAEAVGMMEGVACIYSTHNNKSLLEGGGGALQGFTYNTYGLPHG